MTFEVPGKPRGKARPRFARGRAYTPAETAAYENLVGLMYKQAGGQCLEGPIDLHITAYFPIPPSAPKAKRAQMASGCIQHTIRPDADNLAKAILDGLNGIAFTDDKQVWRLAVEKRYGPEAKAVIRIRDGGIP